MTKKRKSLLGIIMALVIIFSAIFGNSKVLAAEHNGEITITGTTEGKNYSIYKIFDLTQSGEKVSYTIAKDWEAFFRIGAGRGYIVDKNNEEGTLNSIVVGDTIKYMNITDENISDFAKAAMSALSNEKIIRVAQKNADGESLTFSGLELGYYLVHPEGATKKAENQNSIVSLTSTIPNAEIEVKGIYPTIAKEVVTTKILSIGDSIAYEITGEIPDTTGYYRYIYKITDTLPKGIDFNPDVEEVRIQFKNLYVSNEKLMDPDIVNIKKDGKIFEISFDMLQLQDYVGEEIVIQYLAKLNKDALFNEPNINKVTLEYSNDPKDYTKTDTTTDEAKVWTANLIVNKVDGKTKEPLEGAKFVLKMIDIDGTERFYYYNQETGEVEWIWHIEEEFPDVKGL